MPFFVAIIGKIYYNLYIETEVYQHMSNEIVLPNYEHCILNTITSILKYYNVETKHKSLESLDKLLEKNIECSFIVLDGMGEHILNNLSNNGYFFNKKIDCVTSVYPSTTTAAIYNILCW